MVELLICCGLMVILLTAITQVEFASKDYLNRSQTRLDTQLTVISLIPKIQRDLTDAAAGSFQTAPNGFCFATPRNGNGAIQTDSNGDLLWAQTVGYLCDGAGNVTRWTQPIAPLSSSPPTVSCATLQSGGQGTKVAQGITLFQANRSTTSPGLVNITLDCQTTSGAHTLTIELVCSALMRN